MKSAVMFFSFLALTSTLAGCDPYHANEQTGTIVGAVAGGLLGSTIGGGSGRAVAVGVGAVGGALVGSSIGRSVDQQNAYYGGYGYDYQSGYGPAY